MQKILINCYVRSLMCFNLKLICAISATCFFMVLFVLFCCGGVVVEVSLFPYARDCVSTKIIRFCQKKKFFFAVSVFFCTFATPTILIIKR